MSAMGCNDVRQTVKWEQKKDILHTREGNKKDTLQTREEKKKKGKGATAGLGAVITDKPGLRDWLETPLSVDDVTGLIDKYSNLINCY